ncbi:hypothetical protein Mapa_006239 [Marchantia paleacea]|nr:hypothetical protein Mapa_006239 [Marchantia paleacea]
MLASNPMMPARPLTPQFLNLSNPNSKPAPPVQHSPKPHRRILRKTNQTKSKPSQAFQKPQLHWSTINRSLLATKLATRVPPSPDPRPTKSESINVKSAAPEFSRSDRAFKAVQKIE